VLHEGNNMLETCNTTEDCMAVHSKTQTKEAVFEKNKQVFMQHYAKNEALEG